MQCFFQCNRLGSLTRLLLLCVMLLLPALALAQFASEFKILPSDVAFNDEFGHSVAIDGEFAVVGSPNDDESAANSGSAYIFRRNAAGEWVLVKKLTASDAGSMDNFGLSVSISGEYAIVGSCYDNDDGYDSGSAYIFARNQGGTDNWGQLMKLTASDAAAEDNFGISVAITNGFAIVGSRYDDDKGSLSGSAYIFARNQGGIDNWGQLQ